MKPNCIVDTIEVPLYGGNYREVPLLMSTVEHPIKDPPRKGQLPNKGDTSGPLSHSCSSFLTSNERTASQWRTKWLVPKCPLRHCDTSIKPAMNFDLTRVPYVRTLTLSILAVSCISSLPSAQPASPSPSPETPSTRRGLPLAPMPSEP